MDGEESLIESFRDEDTMGQQKLCTRSLKKLEVSLTDHEAVSATNFASERLQRRSGRGKLRSRTWLICGEGLRSDSSQRLLLVFMPTSNCYLAI